MTAATRDDSRSEPEDDFDEGVRWNDRAMFGSFRGLPWWAAVIITFAVAVVGAYVDLSGSEATVKLVFGITFFVGCVGAVVFVERRSMFGPIVQPPLVLAIVVPLMVVFTQGVPTGGLASIGLNLGRPLIDGFPAMALTTVCTVLIGIIRVMIQKDPNRPTPEEVREAKRKPEKPARAGRAEKAERAEKAVPAEDRPKRPRPDAPAERRRPAPADEDRPKRPRPRDGAAGDRPRRPAPREGRPGQRKPRPPRDED
ncbi:DUF6542 domain-containing protein [Saccharothrix syringae]|uniref:DUF6542 domain-containing protein n=1 Tax=Saccharothrix syringae TaxID=103733 RepID=A0A5Q0GS62_SACSY|nr:DUF6542 domain-containing protein [Saccharothrix syringae]QFZ16721.1 hypothetical protein EKG83_03920 [Saccharothrix syringae]